MTISPSLRTYQRLLEVAGEGVDGLGDEVCKETEELLVVSALLLSPPFLELLLLRQVPLQEVLLHPLLLLLENKYMLRSKPLLKIIT